MDNLKIAFTETEDSPKKDQSVHLFTQINDEVVHLKHLDEQLVKENEKLKEDINKISTMI